VTDPPVVTLSTEVTEAFLWGLLAGSSLVLGGLIVFIRPMAAKPLGLVMGFGSGVLIIAVSFELVEEASIVGGGSGAVALGLALGAIVFTLGDIWIERLGAREHKRIGRAAAGASASIVLGTVLDGIPESAVLGLTLLEEGTIGVSMLVAVFVSNLPESVAASDGLLRGGWAKRGILAMWVGVAAVCGLSSALGFALLDGASGGMIALVQSFAAGAILTMLATSMMPEAFEHGGRAAGLTTVLGFIVAYGIDWLAA
jgi:ZIP family zinc transporter